MGESSLNLVLALNRHKLLRCFQLSDWLIVKLIRQMALGFLKKQIELTLTRNRPRLILIGFQLILGKLCLLQVWQQRGSWAMNGSTNKTYLVLCLRCSVQFETICTI